MARFVLLASAIPSVVALSLRVRTNLTAHADADCPCISGSNIDSSGEAGYPKYKKVDYPADVGTSCEEWDSKADPSCAGKTDGWCVDAWCYVDPCTCQGTAKKSSYFPGLKTKEGGKPVYYSYATCGAEDKFTCNNDDPTKRACPCNADESACGGGTNCAWKDGKCIGAELAGTC